MGANDTPLFPELEAPRVLLVALSGIGNLLMATPLLRALKNSSSPRLVVDVLLAPRGTAELLRGHPRVRTVRVAPSSPSLVALARLLPSLRRERYDVGLIAYPSQLVWSAGLLAGALVRRRIGHRYDWWLFRNGGLFLTNPVSLRPLPPFGRVASNGLVAHDVMQNLALLQPLGIRVASAAATYDFPLAAADRAAAEAWLAERGVRGASLIGLHPGSAPDLTFKQWPRERWSALGDALASAYRATVLLFGGPAEDNLTRDVAARMRAKPHRVAAPLRTTAALLARCRAVIANDSGLMHLAASQGVPTVGLFGPTDERRTAPWGPMTVALRAAGTAPSYDVRDLASARRRKGPDSSLLALDVPTVLRAVTTLASRATAAREVLPPS